jgi:AsmA protein
VATTLSPKGYLRRFPRWAVVLLAVLVVLLLIALVVPYFLNVDRYRDTIASAIEKQTGRQVTLGKIRARFLPEIGFVVEGFHLANPEGFPAGDLVSAEQIRGNMALGPLLHGTIHLNSFDLVRPKVMLLTDSRGRDNYTFPAAPKPASAKQDESSSGFSLDKVDRINLSDAQLGQGDVVRGTVVPSVEVKGINLTVRNFALSPMRVRDWEAESTLSGVTISLGGWNAPIAFDSGQLKLSGGHLDAQFVADLAKASDVKGTFDVADVEHPQVNFEMSASKLDLDALMKAAGNGPASKSPARPGGSVPGSSALVAHGHINVQQITTKPYTVGPANAEIRLFTDRAELWPVTIGMYGGTLQISSRVDRVTDPARFTANVQVRNLDIAKVLDVSPSARGKMSGTGELDLQLLGNLSDAWRKTLSGTGKFAVRNGHLPGVNLSGVAESLAKFTGVGRDTPFTVLEGDINIANQRVTSKQIHLDSSSGTVDLKGDLGFDGALDYQGQVVLAPGASGGTGAGSVIGGLVGGLVGSRVGKITVPFALGGTIEDPKVRPGKGIPSFAPPASSASAPSGSQQAQPSTPQNPIDTLKNLFKKR